MKCCHVKKQLPFYVGNDLGRFKHRQVKQHLEKCTACQLELDELAVTRLKSVEVLRMKTNKFEGVNLWDEVLFKLPHRDLIQESAAKPKLSGFHRFIPGLIGAAMVLMVLFFNEKNQLVKPSFESDFPELPVVESVDEPGVTVMTFMTDDPKVTIVWFFMDEENL